MVDSLATVYVVECLLVEMQVTFALVVKVKPEAGGVLEAGRLTGVHRDDVHLLDTVVRVLVLKFQEASAGICMETEYQSGFEKKNGRQMCIYLRSCAISQGVYSQDVSPISGCPSLFDQVVFITELHCTASQIYNNTIQHSLFPTQNTITL